MPNNTIIKKYSIILFLCMGLSFAGCQRVPINKSGLFTTLATKSDRTPASHSETKLPNVTNAWQVYLYCHARWEENNKIKSCYKENYQTEQLPEASRDFERTKREVFAILEQVMGQLEQPIERTVQKRSNFCKENSNLNFRRCLYQYHQQESVALLNRLHTDHEQMNGHEYLFLKKRIHEKLGLKLEEQYALHLDLKKKIMN